MTRGYTGSAYHLFYADGKGSPGSDVTFFDFPLPPERRGINSIVRTALRVTGEKSLLFWRDRLRQAGAQVGEVTEIGGRRTLPFEDGEGQRLAMIDDAGAGPPAAPYDRSSVPYRYAQDKP